MRFQKVLPTLFALCSAQTTTNPWPYQTFQTESQFQPPVLSINKTGAQLADGLIVFTPDGGQESGPVLMTDSGELVWNGPGVLAFNLFVQSLDGQPILTYYSGTIISGYGYGKVEILDNGYNEIYTICPNLTVVTPDGSTANCSLDLHESLVTSRGTILATAVNVTTANLTSVGGPEIGWVYDSLFLEIDIKSQEILFQWSALGAGIPISSTKVPLSSYGSAQSNPFDWFHLNSVQLLGNGYLANSRYTWSTYALSSEGDVEWMIEGSTGGNFSLPSGANFEWQHHARAHYENNNSLILHFFNDYNYDNETNPSNGILLSLDLESRNATLIRAFADPTDEIYSTAEGSFGELGNGNVLLGYGSAPIIKEFGANGDVRMTLQFGGDNSVSYRAYRQVWNATPMAYGPTVVSSQGKGWVSWNGDTRTTQWVIYAGATNSSLVEVGKVNRTGFETEFDVTNATSWLQVSAFDGDKLLGNSSIVTVAVEKVAENYTSSCLTRSQVRLPLLWVLLLLVVGLHLL